MKKSRSVIVSVAEIARQYNCTEGTVRRWIKRYEDFPKPCTKAPNSPAWRLTAIQRWMDKIRK